MNYSFKTRHPQAEDRSFQARVSGSAVDGTAVVIFDLLGSEPWQESACLDLSPNVARDLAHLLRTAADKADAAAPALTDVAAAVPAEHVEALKSYIESINGKVTS